LEQAVVAQEVQYGPVTKHTQYWHAIPYDLTKFTNKSDHKDQFCSNWHQRIKDLFQSNLHDTWRIKTLLTNNALHMPPWKKNYIRCH
jgi:hypothetical protein